MKSLRHRLLDFLRPVIKFIGHSRLPYSKRKITEDHVLKAIKLLKKGDILLSYKGGEFSNLLIKGKYKHVAVFIGGITVGEAVDPKTRPTTIWQFMLSKDKIAILRSKHHTEAQLDNAAKMALNELGKPYDYDFIIEERHKPSKAFYCCEYAYKCLRDAYQGNYPFKLRKILGAETIEPDDFIKASKHFDLILECK